MARARLLISFRQSLVGYIFFMSKIIKVPFGDVVAGLIFKTRPIHFYHSFYQQQQIQITSNSHRDVAQSDLPELGAF